MAAPDAATAAPSSARAARAARFGLDAPDEGVLFQAGAWAADGTEYVRTLRLRNVTGRSLHVRHTLPRARVLFMDFPAPRTVPPGMAAELVMRFRPTEYAPLDDAITVSCETGSFTLPVTAATAALAVAVPPAVELGVVPVGEATTGSLRLANTGQVAASFAVELPPPFAVLPRRGLLPAGAVIDLALAVVPTQACRLEAAARVTVWHAAAAGSGEGVSSSSPTSSTLPPPPPPPPLPGQQLTTSVVSLSAHAKYQHIALVSAAAAPSGGGDTPAALATTTASSTAAPVLLDWGPVEVDTAGMSGGTITGPLHAAVPQQPSGRHPPLLTRTVHVANTGPVPATVTASRLYAGGGGGGDGDGIQPPPFTVSPPSAAVPPGRSQTFAFTFHPHAAGTTRRTPVVAQWLLSAPGGNALRVATAATPVGPAVTIARKDAHGSRSLLPLSSSLVPAVGATSAALSLTRPTTAGSSSGSGGASHGGPPSPVPADVAAGVRACLSFGDVPVGGGGGGGGGGGSRIAPAGGTRRRVLVLTNHASTVPAHWAVADAEDGCGAFLLSRRAGILPPAGSGGVVVTFAPPGPGQFYRRLTFLVRDGDPVTADLTGTAYAAAAGGAPSAVPRPPSLTQGHVERYRRLPPPLRLLPPDAAASELRQLADVATLPWGGGSGSASGGGGGGGRAAAELLAAASAEAEAGLVHLPTPCGGRTRAGAAALAALFDALPTGVPLSQQQLQPVSLSLHPPGSMPSSLPPLPLLDFGFVPRTGPPPRRSVWVTNHSAGRVTVSWVAPVPPGAADSSIVGGGGSGNARLGGARLLSHPSTATALLQLGGPGGDDAPSSASSTTPPVVTRDWAVTPEAADVDPGASCEFRVSFRPSRDARYYSALLEAYAAPKAQRSFRLVQPGDVLPPACLRLGAVGHTFGAGMGAWIPRLETSFGGRAPEQTLALPPVLAGGPPGFYTFQLANTGDVPVAFSLTCGSGDGGRGGTAGYMAFFPSGGLVACASFQLVTVRLSPPPASALAPGEATHRLALPVTLSLNGVPAYVVAITVVATVAARPALVLAADDHDPAGDSDAGLGVRAGALRGSVLAPSLAAAGVPTAVRAGGAAAAPPLLLHLKPAAVGGVASTRAVTLRNPSPLPLSFAFGGGGSDDDDGGGNGGGGSLTIHTPAGNVTVSPAAGSVPAGGVVTSTLTFAPQQPGGLDVTLPVTVTLLAGSETEACAALTAAATPPAAATPSSSGCPAAFALPRRRRVDAASGLEIRGGGSGSAGVGAGGATTAQPTPPVAELDAALAAAGDDYDDDEGADGGSASDDADDTRRDSTAATAGQPLLPPLPLVLPPPRAATVVQVLAVRLVSAGTTGCLRFGQRASLLSDPGSGVPWELRGELSASAASPAAALGAHAACTGVPVGTPSSTTTLILANGGDCTLPFAVDAAVALTLEPAALGAALGRPPTAADVDAAFAALLPPGWREPESAAVPLTVARAASDLGADTASLPPQYTRLLSTHAATDSALAAWLAAPAGPRSPSPLGDPHSPSRAAAPRLLTLSPSSGVIDAHSRLAVGAVFTPPVPGAFTFAVYARVVPDSSSGGSADASDTSACPERDDAVAALAALASARGEAAAAAALASPPLPPLPPSPPFASNNGASGTGWSLLLGRACHPSVRVECACHLASRESLLALFPHHAAVLALPATAGDGGDASELATAAPVPVLAASVCGGGGSGALRRRRRRSSSGGGKPGSRSAARGGTGSLPAAATTASTASTGTLAAAALAAGASPLAAGLLQLQARSRTLSASAAASVGTRRSSATPTAAVAAVPPSPLLPQQQQRPPLTLPLPLPADPMGWVRAIAHTRAGVAWGASEPVPPAPTRLTGRETDLAGHDAARDWTFVLPDTPAAAAVDDATGDGVAAGAQPLTATVLSPAPAPLPSHLLWRLLSLRELNRRLAAGPALLSAAGEHGGRINTAPIPLVFPPAPAGSPPCVALLTLSNPTPVPVTFDVLWPGDGEGGRTCDVEPWAVGDAELPDDVVTLTRAGAALLGGGIGGVDGGGGTRTAATRSGGGGGDPAYRDLADRRVFDVAPRSLTLLPGQTAPLRLHYAYVAPPTAAAAVGRDSGTADGGAAAGAGAPPHMLPVSICLRPAGPAVDSSSSGDGSSGSTVTLQLALTGTTLPAADGCSSDAAAAATVAGALWWPQPPDTPLALAPVPVGGGSASVRPAAPSGTNAVPLRPSSQPLAPLTNARPDAAVRWEAGATLTAAPPGGDSDDTSAGAGGSLPPPLAVHPPFGVLPPGGTVALAALCAPLAAGSYAATVTVRYWRDDGSGDERRPPPVAAVSQLQCDVSFTAYLPQQPVQQRQQLGLPGALSPAPPPTPPPSLRSACLPAVLLAARAGSDPPPPDDLGDAASGAAGGLTSVQAVNSSAAVELTACATQAADDGAWAERLVGVAQATASPDARLRGPDAEAAGAARAQLAEAAALLAVSDEESGEGVAAVGGGAVNCSATSAAAPLPALPRFPGCKPALHTPPPGALALHADAPEGWGALSPGWLRLGGVAVLGPDGGAADEGSCQPRASSFPHLRLLHRSVSLSNLRGAAVLAQPSAVQQSLSLTAAATTSAGGVSAAFSDPLGAGPLNFRWDTSHPLVASGAVSVEPAAGCVAPGCAVPLRVSVDPAALARLLHPPSPSPLAAPAPGLITVDVALPCVVSAPAREQAERAAAASGGGGLSDLLSSVGGTGTGTATTTTTTAAAAHHTHHTSVLAAGAASYPPGVAGALAPHVPVASRPTAATIARQAAATSMAATAPPVAPAGAAAVTTTTRRPRSVAAFAGSAMLGGRPAAAPPAASRLSRGTGGGGGSGCGSMRSLLSTHMAPAASSGGQPLVSLRARLPPAQLEPVPGLPPPPHATLWLRLTCELQPASGAGGGGGGDVNAAHLLPSPAADGHRCAAQLLQAALFRELRQQRRRQQTAPHY
jgi:hypothetical protein